MPDPGCSPSTKIASDAKLFACDASCDPATTALMTNRTSVATSAVIAGVSWPCNCAPCNRASFTISIMREGVSLRNTPTVTVSGGRRLTISRASAGEICRGLGANTKPKASAPRATASNASCSLVMPQILTNMARPPSNHAPLQLDHSR